MALRRKQADAVLASLNRRATNELEGKRFAPGFSGRIQKRKEVAKLRCAAQLTVWFLPAELALSNALTYPTNCGPVCLALGQ